MQRTTSREKLFSGLFHGAALLFLGACGGTAEDSQDKNDDSDVSTEGGGGSSTGGQVGDGGTSTGGALSATGGAAATSGSAASTGGEAGEVLDECDGKADGLEFCLNDEVASCQDGGTKLSEAEPCEAGCADGACRDLLRDCLSPHGCDGDCSEWDTQKLEADNVYAACPVAADQCMGAVELEIPEGKTEFFVRLPAADPDCPDAEDICLGSERNAVLIHLPSHDFRVSYPDDWGTLRGGSYTSGFACSDFWEQSCWATYGFESDQMIVLAPRSSASGPGNVRFELIEEDEVESQCE